MTEYEIVTNSPGLGNPRQSIQMALLHVPLINEGLPRKSIWGEWFRLENGDDMFGIARLYFCPLRGIFAYDGARFLADDRLYCSWKTSHSSYDRASKSLRYRFGGNRYYSPFSTYSGEGDLRLFPTGTGLTPVYGTVHAEPGPDQEYRLYPLHFRYFKAEPEAQLRELRVVIGRAVVA